MAMSRKEVMDQYETVTRGGHTAITSHGKFESEPVYVPSLWGSMLDGGADDEISDPDTGGETSIYAFFIKAEDVKEFPELKNIAVVTMWETDNGFVHKKEFPSKTAYERAKRQTEAALERGGDKNEDDGDSDDFEGLAGCSGTAVCRKG